MGETADPVEQTLSVGTSVLLQGIERQNERVKSVVRGWQRGLYVLLDVPNAKEPTFQFRRGALCVMRYLAEGDACACETELQDLGNGSHFSYIRVQWPADVLRVRVRKHWRVPVNVVCTATTQDDPNEYTGEVKDISAGGCKISLDSPAFSKDSAMRLSFTLPDGSAVNDVNAIVTSYVPQPFGAIYGCQFIDVDEIAINDIEFFVATTLARLRISSHPSPRLLIIDHEIGNASRLKLALKDQDYDLTNAVGVVDGFFALRLAPPALLMIGMEQNGLSAVEMCRAVRATRQFKELPILVYGGTEADKAGVLEAGATYWFPSGDSVKEILAVIESIAPHTSAPNHVQLAGI